MQLCALVFFMESLAETPEERRKIRTGMYAAVRKDFHLHYDRGDSGEKEDNISDAQWMEKARSLGIKDIK